MSLRSLAVLAILLAAGLAGCASKPDAAQPAAVNATIANTTAIVDDGTKTVNMTGMNHMPHMHDYWKGKERVTLFDGDLEPDATNATFASFVQLLSGSPAVGGMQFYLPDGVTVYEGTGEMDLTATYNDPRVTSMRFVYQSAESRDYKNGGPLPTGTTFKLPVTPVMTDPPHSKVSKWWFGFGVDKTPGAAMGPFHLKIEIVRLHDIMMFPAHPDFWQGKPTLSMFDADHHGAQQSYALRAAQPLTNQGGFQEDWVNLSAVVPMETKAMKFNVTINSATSTPGQVVSFGFFYVPADSTAPYRCAVQATPKYPLTVSWIVPVEEQNGDSPYAKASQWRFLVEPQVSMTGQDPSSGGMTNVDYTYHATVTAYQDVQPDAKACRLDRQG